MFDSESKRQAILCGRRFGKTYVKAAKLLETASSRANAHCYYFSTSREQAKRNVWGPLELLNERFSLGCSLNHSELRMTAPSGSTIHLRGLETKRDADKARGEQIALAMIDEAGHIGQHLEYAVDEVLDPTLGASGIMWISGTPNPTSTGFFHEITTSDMGWDISRGTIADNPNHPDWVGMENWEEVVADFLEEKLRQKGWDRESPQFRREWLAEWVRSGESLVIPHISDDNLFDKLPDDEMRHLVGIDFGVVDSTAIVSIAYSQFEHTLWVVDIWEKSGASYTETCKAILDTNAKYKPSVLNADPSPGKVYIQDLGRDNRIPIQAADKRDKAQHVEWIADRFRMGHVKFHRRFKDKLDDIKKLVWLDPERKEIGGEDHVLHALMYGAVEHLGRVPRERPKKKTLEDEIREHKRRLSRPRRSDFAY